MSTSRIFVAQALLTLLLVLLTGCQIHVEAAPREVYHYGIEVNDTLCGYAEIETSEIEVDGEPMTLMEQKLVVMATLLGADVHTEMDMVFHVDPYTGRSVFMDMDVQQGRTHVDFSGRIGEEQAQVSSTLFEGVKTVPLEPDTVVSNPLFLDHLKRDFVDGGLEEQRYDMLELRDAEVQSSTFTLLDRESIELAGKAWNAVVLDQVNHKTGLKIRYWIDAATGLVLKLDLPNDRTVFLADPSVAKKIKVANFDGLITTRAGVLIPDFHRIAYMKVKVSLEPSGQWLTPEALNVPGQRFTGTVEDNRIEGVFEIEHARYEGTGAPPFPPDFGDDETLASYLESADLIDADDPVLAAKAREIAAGSASSWEAAVRISRWVAENIDYAIPGGITARNTYDTRAGECGAHSNLVTALCRSVGIPSRVVWGCMYTPTFGGAFGQHAWNEVYMGEAGWIPLDSTAHQADFVDSGHVRIGIHESGATALNPVAMEVLDYRMLGGADPETAAATAAYDPYVGNYTHVRRGKVVEVRVFDGSLVLDIPDKASLPLDDPDDAGLWVCKLSPKIFVTFEDDEAGAVRLMKLHELIRLRKIAEPDAVDDAVPERYRTHLGTYLLAQLNAEFKVHWHDGSLAVDDPFEKTTVRLSLPDDEGRWVDEYDKNTISFGSDDDGRVTELVIDAVEAFRKG